jgi:hypothetical protein
MIENKQKVTLNFLKNLKRKIHNNFFKFKQKPILLVVDSIQTDMCGVCLVVGNFLLVWKWFGNVVFGGRCFYYVSLNLVRPQF